jgi:CubicO group peptidase (beta-lactamase class C family)
MKHLILIIFLFIFTSCGHKQASEKEFIERGLPESVNVDSELIRKLISDIKADKIKNIHGVLIIKDDKLIAEEYFGDFNRNRLQYSASVTKSFGSTLLGIAIDKGYFGDNIQTVLNKSVEELFPEFENKIQKDSAKNELKLKHLLMMTAGFEWDEHTYSYSDSRNDCNRINNSNDPMNFLFERKLIHKPGKEFYYNGGLSLSISYLIEKYTKMPVDKFAEKFLFEPLSIDNYQWENVANGLIDVDGGLHLKPIDQAKLGYLFLNKGNWKGQQIVSKEWVAISTKMHVKNNY